MRHPFSFLADALRLGPAALLFAAAVLPACSGQDPVPDSGTSTDTEPPVFVDTGWPAGDVGNFHVAYNVNNETTTVYGLAAVAPPNYLNLAQCAIAGTTCFGGFPGDEDTSIDFDPDQDLDRDTTITRFLGFEITVGPYTLQYREDAETDQGFGYYQADGTELGLSEGWIGETWAGQWPEYASTEDLFVPPPIELISPRPGGFLQFTNGSTAVIEWVPTGVGDVTLVVAPKFGDAKLYWLHDDGYFALPADDLGLTGDIEDLTFILSRWSVNEFDRFGHAIRVQATSDASFSGQLLNIGGRDELELADGCDQSVGSPALTAGQYWGILRTTMSNSLDPNNGCLGTSFYSAAAGPDGFIRLEVEPHHNISVDYNLYTQSASVYLVEDCSDANTCFAGSDLYPDPNIHEFVSYFNQTDETKVIYLVLDVTDAGVPDSVFTVDVTDEFLDAPPMYDECLDAEAAASEVPPDLLEPGNYYADFVAYTPDLNPGAGGCTGTSLGGPESIAPLEIPPGATLSVSVSMTDGDPGIYLLYNCVDAFSCAAGADLSATGLENLVHKNYGAYPERVYLVVDSKAGLGPYFLSISM
ncbi:MAG: hypothetical protein ABMA64_12625 [Myxococcota bacterium]